MRLKPVYPQKYMLMYISMYVIMYIMIDIPHTISQFRKSTKVILDATKTNDQWIRRGDELFKVQYMGTVFENGTPAENTPPSKITEVKTPQEVIDNAHKGIHSVAYQVGDLFQPEKSEATASGGVEQPCCKHPTRPCKHWVWDDKMGEGYRNILTGQYRLAG